MDQLLEKCNKPEKIRLVEINPYLTCHLCKGYLIDATTISECLHSFCRSCIIKFLQENSYCPICEVIINKAKPNIKLDKTLQDIVYKLVPELFLNEMRRRQIFYQKHPELAAKITPEERGEDTERIIYNPTDLISLSLEHVSDDLAPNSYVLTSQQQTTDITNNNNTISQKDSANPMKRFLQCPGMCRVEVLKKFVLNKYNVDPSKYHIDILYKRVPLPDHYTMIDIAYIYSWKRNEPLKFFYRITDLNNVTQRFDYLPPKEELTTQQQQSNKKVQDVKTTYVNNHSKKKIEKCEEKTKKDLKNRAKISNNNNRNVNNKTSQNNNLEKFNKTNCDKDTNNKITNELKDILKNDKSTKNPVYTNITLNRSDNLEIITKIQKVSNKSGQPIGLNITTVKKPNRASQNNKKNSINNKNLDNEETKTINTVSENIKSEVTVVLNKSEIKCETKREIKTETKKNESEIKQETNAKLMKKEEKPLDEEIDVEKSNFLKNIELTPKLTPPKQNVNNKKDNISQKRKNPSPLRNERAAKKSRKSAKSLPPTLQTSKNDNDLKLLFDTCNINIPSSLSITIKENGEENEHPHASIKPVQNFIEILKLPETVTTKDESDSDIKQQLLSKTSQHIPCNVMPMKENYVKENFVKLNPRSPKTFQKMFEESIKKAEFNQRLQRVANPPDRKNQKRPMDLTTNETSNTGNNKKNILEIASQLYKKNKMELEKQSNEEKAKGKANIPSPQRLLLPKIPQTLSPPSQLKFEQTIANLHSPSLGMNYTVSVQQNNGKSSKQKAAETSKRNLKSALSLKKPHGTQTETSPTKQLKTAVEPQNTPFLTSQQLPGNSGQSTIKSTNIPSTSMLQNIAIPNTTQSFQGQVNSRPSPMNLTSLHCGLKPLPTETSEKCTGNDGNNSCQIKPLHINTLSPQMSPKNNANSPKHTNSSNMTNSPKVANSPKITNNTSQMTNSPKMSNSPKLSNSPNTTNLLNTSNLINVANSPKMTTSPNVRLNSPTIQHQHSPESNSNLSQILYNTAQISTNLPQISTNLRQISPNSSQISPHSSKTTTISSKITTNLSKITNSPKIPINSSKIPTNSSKISTNSSKITSNSSKISSNSPKITSNSSQLLTNPLKMSLNSLQISPNSSQFKLEQPHIRDTTSKIKSPQIQSNPQNLSPTISNSPQQQITSSSSITTGLSQIMSNLAQIMANSPQITSNTQKPIKLKQNSPQNISNNQQQQNKLSPNQILEKYNIQNLAQLTASFNFPTNFNMSPNQMAAYKQAIILKHFEHQNRQNWLNLSQNYEKYLQTSPNGQKNTTTPHILSNVKEN